MLNKPKFIPADPTKVCRTCSYHDPVLHVCCANDYAIRDEEANTLSCSDWNPKKICITCGYFDPDTNQCWFEEHDMSEEESLTRTCESWELRKDRNGPLQVVGKSCDNCGKCHPIIAMCTEHLDRSIWPPKENVCDEWVEMPAKLQPDGSVKMQAKETIGATIANPESVTRVSLGCLGEKQPEDKPSPFEIPKEAMEALQYSESDMQELRGRTLEALDMMTDIARQQMPGSEKRWLSLRKACVLALRNHWKHHDEAIKPYREEAKSHE